MSQPLSPRGLYLKVLEGVHIISARTANAKENPVRARIRNFFFDVPLRERTEDEPNATNVQFALVVEHINICSSLFEFAVCSLGVYYAP